VVPGSSRKANVPMDNADQQLRHILQLSTRRLEQAGRWESLLNGLESSAAGTRCVHDHGDTDQADEGAGDVEAVGVNRRIHHRVSEPTIVRAHASRPASGKPY
jgi:hypothetical protein